MSEEADLDRNEKERVDEYENVPSSVIFEAIRREGDHELSRPLSALWWSGVAAGLAISTSVLCKGFLVSILPDADWSAGVSNLGYTVGFLIVILGRMQLFTENTITTVLPLMVTPTPRMYWAVARLWAIVLGANVIGAFAIATLYAHTPVLPGDLIPAMMSLSEHAVGMGAADSFWRGIPAGILVAAIVWMIPQAQTSAFFVVLLFTWMIAAGDFTHIVAGSVEMAFLMVQGELGLGPALFGFFLPVLAGNVVGGTVIFTLMAWGQVRDDIVKDGS